MNINLYKTFENFLDSTIKSQSTFSATIAISGGQDSMCLVKLLEKFKKKNIYCLKDSLYLYRSSMEKRQ